MTRGRVVFDRWLMGFKRRIWVGRVVRSARAETRRAIWSAAERAAIATMMEGGA